MKLARSAFFSELRMFVVAVVVVVAIIIVVIAVSGRLHRRYEIFRVETRVLEPV